MPISGSNDKIDIRRFMRMPFVNLSLDSRAGSMAFARGYISVPVGRVPRACAPAAHVVGPWVAEGAPGTMVPPGGHAGPGARYPGARAPKIDPSGGLSPRNRGVERTPRALPLIRTSRGSHS
jgi:hypothetical protein